MFKLSGRKLSNMQMLAKPRMSNTVKNAELGKNPRGDKCDSFAKLQHLRTNTTSITMTSFKAEGRNQ